MCLKYKLQCFLSSEIKDAILKNIVINLQMTPSVFENNNGEIKTIIGDEKNLKITTKEDLKISSYLLR